MKTCPTAGVLEECTPIYSKEPHEFSEENLSVQSGVEFKSRPLECVQNALDLRSFTLKRPYAAAQGQMSSCALLQGHNYLLNTP